MFAFRRPYAWGLAILALVVLFIMISATPAFSYTREHSWALVQAYKKTMDYRISHYERFLVPLLALALALLGLSVYWLYSQMQKKKDSQTRDTKKSLVKRDNKPHRKWVRLPIDSHFLYALHDSDIYMKSRIINIGGGGLLFATNRKLKLKENLKIIIELDTGERLNLAAIVVRFTENTDGPEDYNYLVGIEFIDISIGEQDRLVRMILKKQQDTLQEDKQPKQDQPPEN